MNLQTHENSEEMLQSLISFKPPVGRIFFERLNGFHHEATLQFTLNLTETHSEVWGLRIEVSEVISLPQVGRTCFRH